MTQVLLGEEEAVLLVIEENSTERNLDGKDLMSKGYHSMLQLQQLQKNKPINQVMDEIVVKKHDEENRHQELIMMILTAQLHQPKKNKNYTN